MPLLSDPFLMSLLQSLQKWVGVLLGVGFVLQISCNFRKATRNLYWTCYTEGRNDLVTYAFG